MISSEKDKLDFYENRIKPAANDVLDALRSYAIQKYGAAKEQMSRIKDSRTPSYFILVKFNYLISLYKLLEKLIFLILLTRYTVRYVIRLFTNKFYHKLQSEKNNPNVIQKSTQSYYNFVSKIINFLTTYLPNYFDFIVDSRVKNWYEDREDTQSSSKSRQVDIEDTLKALDGFKEKCAKAYERVSINKLLRLLIVPSLPGSANRELTKLGLYIEDLPQFLTYCQHLEKINSTKSAEEVNSTGEEAKI